MGLCVIVAAALACSGPGPSESPAGASATAGAGPAVPAGGKAAPRGAPDEVLVKFRSGTDERLIARIERECGLEFVKVVTAPDLRVMRIVGGAPLAEVLRRLKAYPEVLQAEPNAVRTLMEN
jgi:hypothetical protein